MKLINKENSYIRTCKLIYLFYIFALKYNYNKRNYTGIIQKYDSILNFNLL